MFNSCFFRQFYQYCYASKRYGVFNFLPSRLMWNKWLIFFVLCAFFGIQNANAQAALKATYVEEELQMDGHLVEEVWLRAERITNFTQRELQVGMPVSERTEAAIVYTKNYLYVGVWCYDSNVAAIMAKEMKRDFDYFLDDNFMVIFDTYGDKRNGFMFVTNPNGARADLQVFNNGGSTNSAWNGVWDVRTTVNSEGWFAEIRIPFYTLKYRTDVEQQVWGVNFERNIRRKREQVRWKGWSRDNQIEQVNQAGTLTGLDSLRNKQFVEFKPFITGGGQQLNGNNERVLNAGGDVNYLLTPTYRLNATVNTDFAQVESDRQQVNITRFPLFFPELREFFLEGNDFFDMGFGGNRIIPFYTRKIGLNSNREPVPILGGVRLLGKEDNTTLGVMSIQTAETAEQATTNYSTASWRQDLGRQSVIGAMTTNKISEGRWHSTTGINGRYSLSTFRGNKNIDMGGALIQTFNNDTGWLNKSFAYRFYIYYPNDRYMIIASRQQSPINFNPEVGLMRRSNFTESFFMFVYKPRPKNKFKFIRQYDFRPAVLTYVQYDDTKALQSFEYMMRYLGFQTRSGETFQLDYKRIGEGLVNDFQIYPGVVIDQGEYWWNQWEAYFETFSGRTLSVNTSWTWGEFYNGNRLGNQSELRWRAGKHMNLNLRYERNEVSLPSGGFTTELIGSRMEYAINPRIFGSVLGQWNNAGEELNMNFRLQIIPKIGTDFFFIVNQIYLRDASGSFNGTKTTVLGKLIWRVAG